VWFAELGEPREREYLIEKIGVKGYPIVAFGAGGVAKSFAMLSAGIAISSASGVDDWLGLKVLEHGYVLYLDFELDVEEQHRRVRDLCAGMGVMIPAKLAYLSGVGISPDKAFQKALAFVEKYEAKAVIIDSMGLAMQGDMEKGKEVLAFHGRYINPLRRAGATPFIVDHEGKLQTGEKHKDKSPFGSAYKAWASRSVLQFVFEEYREEASELDIRVRQTKTNFGPKIDPIGMRFTFGDKNVSMGGYRLPDEELIEEESRPVKERIIAALKLEGATIKQLAQLTGASEGTIRNKLVELRNDGLIEDDGKKPTTYNLLSSSPGNTGVSSDDDNSDLTVERLFHRPPGWLAAQIVEYRLDPDRHFSSLCAAVSSVVLEDPSRGEEVAEEVKKELAEDDVAAF
jgi:DNA-binding transcriptional ArsR family regulator